MYQYRGKEGGFTFVEALLHLLLLAIFAQLLFFILMQYKEMSDIRSLRLEADWEIGVSDINQYFPYGRSTVKVSEDGQVVTVIIKETVTMEVKVYYILFLNNVLWKREKNGNETLLTGVKSARFTLNRNRLLLKAELGDGVERERIFIVEPYSE